MPNGRLVRTAPANHAQSRGVDPGRMTKFLDNPSPWGLQSFGNSQHLTAGGAGGGQSRQQQSVSLAGGGGTRSVRPKTVYDPSLTWDGLSVHPQAFSKLNIDPRVQGKMLLAGSRVILTEKDHLPGGLFSGVPAAGPGMAAVDPTVAQRDCRFDAGPEAPANVAAASNGALSLTYTDQKFENMMVRPAAVGVRPTPSPVATALRRVPGGTSELTRFLLTPGERREIQATEQQEQSAKEVAKRAELQRRHLAQTLRDRYPHGALRVDGTDNGASEVYGARAAAKQQAVANAMAHAEGRRGRLRDLTMQEPRFGYKPFDHNEEFLGRRETKFMQEKKLPPAPPPDTHDRLFGAKEVPRDPARAQNLREKDLYGKTYNLVTQAAVVDHPSVIPTRHDYAFMAHPSQASLHLDRSAQGRVTPGDRSTGVVLC